MSALALDLPISPELVLVSPPEEASLARQLLPDLPVAPRASAARVRSIGVAAFYAFCLANCLVPFVFALTVAR